MGFLTATFCGNIFNSMLTESLVELWLNGFVYSDVNFVKPLLSRLNDEV